MLTASGSRTVPGQDHGSGLPQPWDRGTDLLPLVHGGMSVTQAQTFEGAGAREPAIETTGGGIESEQTGPSRGGPGKLLSPERRRQCVRHVQHKLGASA